MRKIMNTEKVTTDKGNLPIYGVISSNLKLLWWGWSTFWGIFMIVFAILYYCL